MEKYDVIIIGAGIGGLTAGAILAKNGKKVLVLEKNPMAGGYAVNFKRGEFEFDVAIHLVNGFAKGGMAYSILERCGVANKLTFLKPKYVCRSIFPDIDIRIPQNNTKEYISILTKYFPKEKEGLEELFKLLSKIFCRVEDVEGEKISPSDFSDFVNNTYEDIMNEFLHDVRLKSILSQLWPYYASPPSKLSALYYTYPYHDYITNGAYYPSGGGKALSGALIDSFRENNGKVIFNASVKKVIIKENTACGVQIKDGHEFFTEYLISNIDAYSTFKNLVGQEYLESSFLNEINKMEPSLSAFQVFLGLNADLKKMGIDDYTIYVFTDYDMDKQYKLILNNDFYNVPFQLALYSNIEDSYAPEGKFTMTITVLSNYDFWKNLSKDEYKEQKRRVADILIKRTEQIIPNLASYVEVVETATPLTMKKYTNSSRGAIYGWSQIISQSGSRRLKNKTPVNNLYLVGAWTQPGPGIKAVMQSAMVVSNKILERDI